MQNTCVLSSRGGRVQVTSSGTRVQLRAHISSSTTRPRRAPLLCRAAPSDDSKEAAAASSSGRPADTNRKEPGTGLKAAWYGAELLGDVAAALKGGQQQQQQVDGATGANGAATTSSTSSSTTTTQVRSLSQVVASIREDYDVDYFISGQGAMEAYDPDCLFADDFTSFRGVARFKKNVANLGALTRDVKLEVSKIDEDGNKVVAHWKFSAILALPWRPLLAAAGDTTHVIDLERGVVVEHLEHWKSNPTEVVKRLLRPASKVPTNAWETFMAAASVGDVKGCWMAVSGRAAAAAAPLVGATLLWHAITGSSLPAWAGGSVLEVTAGAVLVTGLLTEVLKFAQGMQGGETGTGGRF